uniref:Uncharacterized protein n=1 Tax=Anguilla anguilla TaxID=7936 RepID=A0A0E9VYK9_ANGAN
MKTQISVYVTKKKINRVIRIDKKYK